MTMRELAEAYAAAVIDAVSVATEDTEGEGVELPVIEDMVDLPWRAVHEVVCLGVERGDVVVSGGLFRAD